MIVSTEAIVLHAMKYGDTSKIVTLYTRKFGKVSVIAKGVRTSKNKMGASLEPMAIVSAVFYKKQHRDLSLLSKCEIALPLKNLFADEEKLAAGLAVVELLSMAMHGEHEDEALFCTVVEAITEIDRAHGNPINVFIAFIMNFIHRFGVRLTLERCVRCTLSMENTSGNARVQLTEGTIVCALCAKEGGLSGMPLSAQSVKSLLSLDRVALSQSTEVAMSVAERDESLEVLQVFMRCHIAGMKPLRSLRLLTW